jgi:hypothetical protein
MLADDVPASLAINACQFIAGFRSSISMQRQTQGSDAKRLHEHACLGRAVSSLCPEDCPPNCVRRFGFEHRESA